MSTQTAFIAHAYGGPASATLRTTSVPTPGPRELLVAVQGAGLNPVDFKTREGALKLIYRPQFPFVLGNELSGRVVAVGADVADFQVGDAIVARVEKERMGAFAQYASVHEDTAAPAPNSVDLVDAAGLPLAGLTALQALRDCLCVGPDTRVLITGGAGGVGTLAVQIARILGAHVTTTASPRGHALVTSLGAHAVIDYTQTPLAAVSETFDCAFDLVGGADLAACFAKVRPGGKVVSVAGLPTPETAAVDLQRGFPLNFLFWLASWGTRRQATRAGVTYRYLFMRPSGADLRTLVAWVDEGKLRPIVDRRFDFADIADAFAYLESGRAKGKVVVAIGPAA